MNDLTLGFSIPVWIAIPIIIAAWAFAFWTYRTTLPPVPSGTRRTLITLRTLGIALLLLTLFDLVFGRRTMTPEDPVVAGAIDFSESMGLDGKSSQRIDEALGVMRNVSEEIGSDDMTWLGFSDSTRFAPPSTWDSLRNDLGPTTDLSLLLSAMADSARYRNLQAIVIATDGRFTQGNNPLLQAERLGIPIYAVGLGDSTESFDIAIEEIFTNDVGFVGMPQPVRVRVRGYGLSVGRAEVALRADGVLVGTVMLALQPGVVEYVTTMVWTPRSEGTARVTASVSSVGGERTTENNARSTLVRVRSNKRAVLLISGSPNPDYSFLKRTLASNPSIELTARAQRDGTSFLEGALTAEMVRDAETIILVDYPTTSSNASMVSTIASTIRERSTPLLVVLGENVDYGRLSALQEILPVTIGDARPGTMETLVELTPAGRAHGATGVGDSIDWSDLPPLFTSGTTVTPRPDADILATARIGSTRLNDPLIIARNVGRARSLLVNGYGIWRWKLIGEGREIAAGRPAMEVLDRFLSGSLLWLGTRDQQRQVTIRTSRKVYGRGESVRFQGFVYDASNRPVDGAVVEATITGGGRDRRITLGGGGAGQYETVVSGLPPGDYTFTGRAERSGRTIGTDAGRFIVEDRSIELEQTSMESRLLRSLAERSGGRFYTIDDVDSLIDHIRAHERFTPRTIEHRTERAFRDSFLILLLALGIFSIEWIIRKRNGLM